MHVPSWRPSIQLISVSILGLLLAANGLTLWSANERSKDKTDLVENSQTASDRQIDELREQIERLAQDFAAARAEAEQAKTQANASVDQLVQEGIKPIVAAPDVVTVPTVPVTTTTQLPIVVVPAIPVPTTTTTTEPPETTTTTAVPETTTTTTTSEGP